MKKNKKEDYKKWYFLSSVVIIYGLVSLYAPEKSLPILVSFFKLLGQILPIFLVIYVLMTLTNLYINNDKLRKHLGEDAGIKGWVISILAGIVSMGSIYVWYPLLTDLQQKGVKDKFIVTFLYNRGIKLQWLPVLLIYFGWAYAITLLLVMVVFSVFQGIITEKLINSFDKPSSDTLKE